MKFFISVFLLLLPFLSISQVFDGGVIAGLSASQIDGDKAGGYNKPGFAVMGYADWLVKPNWKIFSGIGYVQKGAHSNSKIEYFSTYLHYAEIPLLVEYQAFDKMSFSVGLAYGYLIKGGQKTSFGDLDEKDLDLLRSEFSSYLVLNYKINNRLSVNFVDNYSLVPINENTSNFLRTNLFVYYIFMHKQGIYPYWWNNTLRLTLQYKIYWTE